jgi:NAD(P)-dependent dehydrogenase (short-subunit alcohol dehydrogenase family)
VEADARVVISSRKPEACEGVRNQIFAGKQVLAIAAHAAREEDIVRLIARTMEHFGRIDIVVANAATNPVFTPLAELPEDSWTRILDTNLSGPLRLARHALPHMAAGGGGSMVLVSSINAQRGVVGSGAYGVSKAGLEQLTRQLAVEWGGRNIRINAVAPGTIRTDMIRTLAARPGFLDGVERATPLRRIGEAEDVAAAIVFLASKLACHITGQVLTVDGGQTIARSVD